MADTLFKSDEDRIKAVNLMKQLKTSEEWKIVVQALDRMIDGWRDKLLDGFGEQEDFVTVQYIRDRIKLLKSFKETPERLIEAYSDTAPKEAESFDPYYTPEQLAKERRRQT